VSRNSNGCCSPRRDFALAAARRLVWNTGAGRCADRPHRQGRERGRHRRRSRHRTPVNPVTSVQVGSQVSGQIKRTVSSDFNSPVKQGMLESRGSIRKTFQVRRAPAEADLEAARSPARAPRSGARSTGSATSAQQGTGRAANFVSPANLRSREADLTTSPPAAELKTANAGRASQSQTRRWHRRGSPCRARRSARRSTAS